MDPVTRISQLRDEIRRHEDRYYIQNDPEITDEAFDALVKELEALEAEYPDLVTPDSPTQRVGSQRRQIQVLASSASSSFTSASKASSVISGSFWGGVLAATISSRSWEMRVTGSIVLGRLLPRGLGERRLHARDEVRVGPAPKGADSTQRSDVPPAWSRRTATVGRARSATTGKPRAPVREPEARKLKNSVAAMSSAERVADSISCAWA